MNGGKIISELTIEESLLDEKKMKEPVAIFANELSENLRENKSIIESLGIIAEQTKNKSLKKIILKLKDDMISDSSFSEALEKFPNIFDSTFINLIKIGEKNKNLSQILKKISIHLEYNYQLKEEIRNIILFSDKILIISTSIILFLIIFIFPSFKSMYADMSLKRVDFCTKLFVKFSIIGDQSLYLIITIFLIFYFIIKSFARSKKCIIFLNKITPELNFIKQSKNIILFRKFYTTFKKDLAKHLKEFKILPDSDIEIICEKNSDEKLENILSKIIRTYEIKLLKKVNKFIFIYKAVLLLFFFLFIIVIIFALFTPMDCGCNMQP